MAAGMPELPASRITSVHTAKRLVSSHVQAASAGMYTGQTQTAVTTATRALESKTRFAYTPSSSTVTSAPMATPSYMPRSPYSQHREVLQAEAQAMGAQDLAAALLQMKSQAILRESSGYSVQAQVPQVPARQLIRPGQMRQELPARQVAPAQLQELSSQSFTQAQPIQELRSTPVIVPADALQEPSRPVVVPAQPPQELPARPVAPAPVPQELPARPARQAFSARELPETQEPLLRKVPTREGKAEDLPATSSVPVREAKPVVEAGAEAEAKGLDDALQGFVARVEYHSNTHGEWISAKVVATDPRNGTLQIDKKPGVWLSASDARLRISSRRSKEAKARPEASEAPASKADGVKDSERRRLPQARVISSNPAVSSSSPVSSPSNVQYLGGLSKADVATMDEPGTEQAEAPSFPAASEEKPRPEEKSALPEVQAGSSSTSTSASSREARDVDPTQVKFRCPVCGEVVSSIDEALTHCGINAVNEGADGGLPAGECIACDEHGRPSIVRSVDAETRKGRTVVRNEDGSQRIFDDEAIVSLTGLNAEELTSFVESLTSHQLRGLVHEVGQRLLENSQLYHSRLAELERLGENLNFEFFGLASTASEKDLDNAYRKMAKKMHPDKNGGTDSAKRRFQDMKERYEALKKRLSGEDGSKDGDESPAGEEPEEEKKEEKDEKSTSIEYDPSDKDCMAKTVTKMARQLKNIDIQMKVLVKELGRVKQHTTA